MADRNPRGRFAPGNRASRGRRVGSKNKATTDFRKIKEQLAGSYDRVNGDAIFDRLASEQPAVWCSLIVKCFPKELVSDVHIEQRDPLNMAGAGSELDPTRDPFQRQLYELSGGRQPTAEEVHQQLEINRNTRLGRSCLEDDPGGNGRMPGGES